MKKLIMMRFRENENGIYPLNFKYHVFYIQVLELELVFQESSLLVSLITSFPLHNVPRDTKALAIPRPDCPGGVYCPSPGGSLTISESTAALPPEQGSSAIGVGWHCKLKEYSL